MLTRPYMCTQLPEALLFSKKSFLSFLSACIHWQTSMNQAPQIVAVGQHITHVKGHCWNSCPPSKLTWTFCRMRAGVTLLGMVTTLRCTCHLLKGKRKTFCAGSTRIPTNVGKKHTPQANPFKLVCFALFKARSQMLTPLNCSVPEDDLGRWLAVFFCQFFDPRFL